MVEKCARCIRFFAGVHDVAARAGSGLIRGDVMAVDELLPALVLTRGMLDEGCISQDTFNRVRGLIEKVRDLAKRKDPIEADLELAELRVGDLHSDISREVARFCREEAATSHDECLA